MKLPQSELHMIENFTLDLLKNAYETGKITLPIQLNQVVKQTDIVIEVGRFDNPEISSVYKRDLHSIFSSEEDRQPYRNYSISHQLGHYFLHEAVEESILYKLDVINPNLANGHTDKELLEARMFAASLLMPNYLVHRYWEWFRSVKDFSYIFQVSNSLAYMRLASLGLMT